jgi:hypothetical protein
MWRGPRGTLKFAMTGPGWAGTLKALNMTFGGAQWGAAEVPPCRPSLASVSSVRAHGLAYNPAMPFASN